MNDTDKLSLLLAVDSMPDRYLIGFKIQLPSVTGINPTEIAVMLLRWPFALMLTQLLEAAFVGNLKESNPPSLCCTATMSGFLGLIGCVNPEAGFTAIQQILDKYKLARLSEVVWRGVAGNSFHHYSGNNFGPFEAHIDEQKKYADILKSAFAALDTTAP